MEHEATTERFILVQCHSSPPRGVVHPAPVLARLERFLSALPTLTHLTLILDKQPAVEEGNEAYNGPDIWSLPSATCSLACPALTTLVLSVSDELRRLRHTASDIRLFIATTLPQSAGPLCLRLVRVELEDDAELLKPEIWKVVCA